MPPTLDELLAVGLDNSNTHSGEKSGRQPRVVVRHLIVIHTVGKSQADIRQPRVQTQFFAQIHSTRVLQKVITDLGNFLSSPF